MGDYTDSGCIDIVGAAFKKGLKKTSKIEEIKTNLQFVEDSVIFRLWCIVTEQNEERLKNLTKIRNHSFIKEIRNGECRNSTPIRPFATEN